MAPSVVNDDDDISEIVAEWLKIPPAQTVEESMQRHPANPRLWIEEETQREAEA